MIHFGRVEKLGHETETPVLMKGVPCLPEDGFQGREMSHCFLALWSLPEAMLFIDLRANICGQPKAVSQKHGPRAVPSTKSRRRGGGDL